MGAINRSKNQKVDNYAQKTLQGSGMTGGGLGTCILSPGGILRRTVFRIPRGGARKISHPNLDDVDGTPRTRSPSASLLQHTLESRVKPYFSHTHQGGRWGRYARCEGSRHQVITLTLGVGQKNGVTFILLRAFHTSNIHTLNHKWTPLIPDFGIKGVAPPTLAVVRRAIQTMPREEN